MGIESRLASGRWYGLGERETEKHIQMDDAVHVAARTLDGPLECIHGPCDMLFEGVSYEDVIVLGITVIGACAGKVVDAVVRVASPGPANRTSFAFSRPRVAIALVPWLRTNPRCGKEYASEGRNISVGLSSQSSFFQRGPSPPLSHTNARLRWTVRYPCDC